MKSVLASAAALCAAAFVVGASAQSTGAMARSGQDKMGQDRMARADVKTGSYTGCVEAGKSPRTYVLADVASVDDQMAKGAMAEDSMSRSKSAMGPATLVISSTAVDLSKYIGSKVAVTGSARSRQDAMGKDSPPWPMTRWAQMLTPLPSRP